MKLIENPETKLMNEWKKYIGKYIYYQNKYNKDNFGFLRVYDVRMLGKREDKATLLYVYIGSDSKEVKTRAEINKLDFENNIFNLISKKEFNKLRVLFNLNETGE